MNYSVRPADLFPAIICTAYYGVVFLSAEIARKVVDLTFKKKNNLWYTFLIELIATAQMTTCVYENGIIIKNYGPWGFFLTVFSLLIVAGFINRGAYVSPLTPIELFVRGAMSAERFLTILSAQALGGFSAFRLANGLWYYSMNYSADHHAFYERLPCQIMYKVPFSYAFAYEIFACFLLRLIIHRLPNTYKQYTAPALVAGFLSFALAYIGIPGLNPTTASSRLQGCPGLDLQWFIMTYWCCPVVGWLFASKFDRKIRHVSKKEKKQVKETKKQQ
ncbi:putative aquaporin-10 [Ditylenchus destructor]|uniref:Aquaporin n=1 Tax=Ditylenchus destructor TaxID=166010 RepID=A0AAD4RAG7_9BILA|nr:putative aquaporin-10 [Ditylenchus destructor]